MTITSTAFLNNDFIPSDYACDGENVNPPLTFSLIPKKAKSPVNRQHLIYQKTRQRIRFKKP